MLILVSLSYVSMTSGGSESLGSTPRTYILSATVTMSTLPVRSLALKSVPSTRSARQEVQARIGNAAAAVVVRMKRKLNAVAVFEVVVHIFNLRRINVRK